jgi:hypothetical protein
MDWDAAIEKNLEALKRVLAMLIAMAGLDSPACRPPSELLQGERTAAVTLPRHLHRAVLRLLRPAEAAARRLIIVAARGVSSRFAEGKSVVPVARWKAGERRVGAEHRAPGRKGAGRDVMAPASPRRLAFPLFDPAYRFRRHRPARSGVPRISFPGFSEPFHIPPPPSADDAVDATRLALRFVALARVLDDLPREARRFARWRAARVAAGTQNEKDVAAGAQIKGGREAGRIRRVWPLRPGRPPGHLSSRDRRPRHDVYNILDVVHGLAFWALESPDTS